MISYMTHSIHYLEYKKLECHADASGLVQQVRGLLACNCRRVAYAGGVRGAQSTSGETQGRAR